MSEVLSRRKWSLTARLGWRLAAVVLAAIFLAAGAIAWRAVVTVHDLDDQGLEDQARLLVAQLPADAAAKLALPGDVVLPFRASEGDNIFMIYRGGLLAATSDKAASARVAPFISAARPSGFFRIPVMEGHRRGMIGLSVQSGPWRVMVMQGHEQSAVLLESLASHFLAGAVFLLLPIGLVGIVVAVMTLRRGLRPLREVSAAARLVGPSRPGARLPTSALPDEVYPLVRTMNDALSRLDQALLGQRRFMADAAHALRTPLAVLTARLDMLESQPELDGLRQDVDRMSRLVGQLLRISRLETIDVDTAQPVRLHDVAAEAIMALAPLAIRGGVEIALTDDSVGGQAVAAQVHGNHAALVLATTNLIENALDHAPRGSLVDVVLGQNASICVLDRGPGVAPEQRERIFSRFVRGPQAREGGAGIGLAIVAEIAHAHHGSVEVGDVPGGGSAFTLRLNAEAGASSW